MRKPSYLTYFAGLLGLALANGPAFATNYFNWGFESMRPSWGISGPATYNAIWHGNTSQDCTVSHTGSCSMKLKVPSGSTGDPLNNGMGADLMDSPPVYGWPIINSRALYYRWWMRIEPGFGWGPNQGMTKSSRIFSAKDSGRTYTGYVHAGGIRISECDPHCYANDGDNVSESKIAIGYNIAGKNDGKWHEYIVKVKANTSATCTPKTNCDGQLELWVDGTSVGTYNNWKLTELTGGSMQDAWGGWMVSPYFQLGAGSAGGTIYIDDASTDDAWNSLAAPSGPTGGGTTPPSAPPAPTNLLIK